LVGEEQLYIAEKTKALIAAKVPKELAIRISNMRALGASLNVIHTATSHKVNVQDTAEVYFNLMDSLGLVWFREQINSYPIDTHWAILARSAVKADLDWFGRLLMMGVLTCKDEVSSAHEMVATWMEQHEAAVLRWKKVLTELKSTGVREYTMLSVAMRELAELARTGIPEEI